MQNFETRKASEIIPVYLAFIGQNIGSLSVDDLEDMKQFIFNLIEEIDGTIQMANGGPATTRE